MKMRLPNPWWTTDTYDNDAAQPDALLDPTLWGPKGPALVQLWGDGATQPGWGKDEFMKEYTSNRFNLRKILYGYHKGAHAFAWVMRSAQMICVDIDGKNGGLEHVVKLGLLPPTLAEVSKSGNGYHLFYRTNEEWHADEGFAEFRDQIGIETGVDLRATGCVYHYASQRWNARTVANLPEHLATRLKVHVLTKTQFSTLVAKTKQLDPEELLMLHSELIQELETKIPVGRRNNTLFAIGSKMKQAGVHDWENLVVVRASQVGLTVQEADKIIANIQRYG